MAIEVLGFFHYCKSKSQSRRLKIIATITSKGQVTIPLAIRKKYGLGVNDRVDFSSEGDRIILAPVKPLRDFRGSVTGSGDPDGKRQATKDAVGRRTIAEMS